GWAAVLEGDVADGGTRPGLQEGQVVGVGDLVVAGADDGVVDPGDGVTACVELVDEVRADGLLDSGMADEDLDETEDVDTEVVDRPPQSTDPVEAGAVMGGAVGDEVLHLGRAAFELGVPVRHRPTLGMGDDVDLTGAGGGQYPVDEHRELLGRVLDISGAHHPGQYRSEPTAFEEVGAAVVEGEGAEPGVFDRLTHV